jgi:glycosyltransferase involved in cell wall biosynthesis
MVTACYKPVVNGVTRMVSMYKTHLEARGHEVTIFTLGAPDSASDEQGVVRSPGVPLGSTGYYFSPRYSQKAQDLLKQMDIIHCHHLFMGLEFAHRYSRCPIVYTNHTRYDLYLSAYSQIPQPVADLFMRRLWPRLTEYCDVVVAPSGSLQEVMEVFGVRQPVIVIENGIDLSLYQRPSQPVRKSTLAIPDEAVVVAYAGRLSAEKNVSKLLDEFGMGQSSFPTLHLLLIGTGPQAGLLQKQVRKLGLVDNVHFTGSVDYELVPNLLAAADIFATASVSEVHPLAVIEAAACGLPVVAYNSPGILETIEDGVSGMLTSQARGYLASAFVILAMSSKRRHYLGDGARKSSNRYDMNRTVERTSSLYQSLLEERPDLLRLERARKSKMVQGPVNKLARHFNRRDGVDGRYDH